MVETKRGEASFEGLGWEKGLYEGNMNMAHCYRSERLMHII